MLIPYNYPLPEDKIATSIGSCHSIRRVTPFRFEYDRPLVLSGALPAPSHRVHDESSKSVDENYTVGSCTAPPEPLFHVEVLIFIFPKVPGELLIYELIIQRTCLPFAISKSYQFFLTKMHSYQPVPVGTGKF